jgi:hypothetical protein
MFINTISLLLNSLIFVLYFLFKLKSFPDSSQFIFMYMDANDDSSGAPNDFWAYDFRED